jgi:hypothetical protein
MTDDEGGPAFPTTSHRGMSLRDYFAAKAMQTFLAIEPETTFTTVARWAYGAADGMLAERKGKGGPAWYPHEHGCSCSRCNPGEQAAGR